MNEKIEALKSSFDSELKKIANMVDLEALRVNYLGRKGKVTDALKGMGNPRILHPMPKRAAR